MRFVDFSGKVVIGISEEKQRITLSCLSFFEATWHLFSAAQRLVSFLKQFFGVIEAWPTILTVLSFILTIFQLLTIFFYRLLWYLESRSIERKSWRPNPRLLPLLHWEFVKWKGRGLWEALATLDIRPMSTWLMLLPTDVWVLKMYQRVSTCPDKSTKLSKIVKML